MPDREALNELGKFLAQAAVKAHEFRTDRSRDILCRKFDTICSTQGFFVVCRSQQIKWNASRMESNDPNIEQIIRFRPVKLILFFWPVVVFSSLCMLYNPQGWRNGPEWTNWAFGAVILFVICGCVVLPRTFYLRLAPGGLQINRIASQQNFAWNEVSDFRIVNGPSHSGIRIVWNVAEHSPHRTKLMKLTRATIGYDASLLDTFELSAKQLVTVLDDWQQEYSGDCAQA